MNQHAVGAVGRQCFEAEPNRILPRCPASDRRKHSQASDGTGEQRPVFWPDGYQDIRNSGVLGKSGNGVAQHAGAS